MHQLLHRRLLALARTVLGTDAAALAAPTAAPTAAESTVVGATGMI